MSKGRAPPEVVGGFTGNDGWIVKTATAVLALLLCLFVASQFYRTMPRHSHRGRDFIDSDKLIFPDFFIELTGGGAEHGDWVSNPAPYFLSDYAVFGLASLVAGVDFRLSLAIHQVAMTLAIALALAFVIRQATPLAPVKCALAALVATSWLALQLRHGGAWLGSMGGDHRQANTIMFFLAACGLARVATSPKALHPLLYAYLAACFMFGLSDAMFLFHVAMPVALVAFVWWVLSPGSAKARAVVACAAAGCVLVYAGRATLPHVSPFIANQFAENWLNLKKITWSGWVDTFFDEGPIAAIVQIEAHAVGEITRALKNLFLGRNWPTNLLLACCGLALAPWLARGPLLRDPAGNPQSDRTAIFLPVLSQLVLALYVSFFVIMAGFVTYLQGYAFPLLWIPLLSLAVVWAHLYCKGGHDKAGKAARLCAPLLTVLAAAALAVDLAFFRPSDHVAERIGCVERIVEDSGLSRGLVPQWHGRQVKVATAKKAHDLLYIADVYPDISMYGHVGNIQQLHGRADYIVTYTRRPWVMAGFRATYGLPARVELCASERYLLYESGHLDSDKIRDIYPDIDWRHLLLDPDDPDGLAKARAAYSKL